MTVQVPKASRDTVPEEAVALKRLGWVPKVGDPVWVRRHWAGKRWVYLPATITGTGLAHWVSTRLEESVKSPGGGHLLRENQDKRTRVWPRQP